MSIKQQYGLSNYELAEAINGLSDDDFYGVMFELANLNNCHRIDQFGDWIKRVLWEINDDEEDF